MGHFVLFKKIIILILSFVLISTTVYGKSIETIQTSGDVSAGIEINADGAWNKSIRDNKPHTR